MILRVLAELVDDGDPQSRPIIGFNREEVVYADYEGAEDDREVAKRYGAEMEAAGTQLLDWLEEAKEKVGKQAARLSGGLPQ